MGWLLCVNRNNSSLQERHCRSQVSIASSSRLLAVAAASPHSQHTAWKFMNPAEKIRHALLCCNQIACFLQAPASTWKLLQAGTAVLQPA